MDDEIIKEFRKKKPIVGAKITSGIPLRASQIKPRLSMRLLYRLYADCGLFCNSEERSGAKKLLYFIESQTSTKI